MANLADVTLSGVLTCNSKILKAVNGNSYLAFSLGVSKTKLDKATGSRVVNKQFYYCTYFLYKNTAESTYDSYASIMVKGKFLVLQGRLSFEKLKEGFNANVEVDNLDLWWGDEESIDKKISDKSIPYLGVTSSKEVDEDKEFEDSIPF